MAVAISTDNGSLSTSDLERYLTGDVREISDFEIVVGLKGVPSTSYIGSYTGNFSVNRFGDLSGMVTDFKFAYKSDSYTFVTIDGFAIRASRLISLISDGKAYKLISEIFSGDDIIDSREFMANYGRPNIFGYAGNDYITGSFANDTINGGKGADTIRAGGGADGIDAGSGADVVLGELGNDKIRGGSGKDSLYGSYGADELRGGGGDDKLVGGQGEDLLHGGSGADKLSGGGGGDVLKGGGRGDRLKGGGGNDRLSGDSGWDMLRGGSGDDLLWGGGGKDKLRGGGGNDSLKGGSQSDNIKGQGGSDNLWGGGGDDHLEGGRGSDVLKGGAGSDTFVYKEKWGRDTIFDFEDNIDRLDLSDFGFAKKGEAMALAQSHDGDVVFEFGWHELTLENIDKSALWDDLVV